MVPPPSPPPAAGNSRQHHRETRNRRFPPLLSSFSPTMCYLLSLLQTNKDVTRHTVVPSSLLIPFFPFSPFLSSFHLPFLLSSFSLPFPSKSFLKRCHLHGHDKYSNGENRKQNIRYKDKTVPYSVEKIIYFTCRKTALSSHVHTHMKHTYTCTPLGVLCHGSGGNAQHYPRVSRKIIVTSIIIIKCEIKCVCLQVPSSPFFLTKPEQNIISFLEILFSLLCNLNGLYIVFSSYSI